jgi:hypothetical protein
MKGGGACSGPQLKKKMHCTATLKEGGKKAPKKTKRKMNAFMKAKENARKKNLDEFEYTNKDGKTITYKKFIMKTGMVAYKAKK